MKQLHEYSTPETDKHIVSSVFASKYAPDTDHMQNMEQRLAACRDALDEILESELTPMSLRVTTPATIAKRALNLTKPQ
jgi:hypothetical protein